MKMKAMNKRSIQLATPPVSKQYKAGKDNIWTKLALNLIQYQIKNSKEVKKYREKRWKI